MREIVGEYQWGFKLGKSTVDHVFTAKELIEKHYEYNKLLHLFFEYFKQAKDSIKGKSLWKSMDKFGILLKLIRMARACIDGLECKIKFGNQYSRSEFEVRIRGLNRTKTRRCLDINTV